MSSPQGEQIGRIRGRVDEEGEVCPYEEKTSRDKEKNGKRDMIFYFE